MIVDLPITISIFPRILDQITMIVPLHVLEEDVKLPIVESKNLPLVWQTYRMVESLLSLLLIQIHWRYIHATILASLWLMLIAGLVDPMNLIDVGLLYKVDDDDIMLFTIVVPAVAYSHRRTWKVTTAAQAHQPALQCRCCSNGCP